MLISHVRSTHLLSFDQSPQQRWPIVWYGRAHVALEGRALFEVSRTPLRQSCNVDEEIVHPFRTAQFHSCAPNIDNRSFWLPIHPWTSLIRSVSRLFHYPMTSNRWRAIPDIVTVSKCGLAGCECDGNPTTKSNYARRINAHSTCG